MAVRVRITDNYMLDRIAVMISPKERRILHWEVTETEYDPNDTRQVYHDDPSVLSLPEEVLRALYEELGKHFRGSSDYGALRRDYNDERKRVDKFIQHLTRD